MTQPLVLDGVAPALIIADHASNAVPPGIDLGVPPGLLEAHVALDIGTEPLARALAAALDAPAIIARVSRLVVDLNRAPDEEGAVPSASDGHLVPGNLALPESERQLRIAAIHAPYHTRIAAEIEARAPALLVSVHSFTPQLATRPDEARPWPVGLLWNRDDRAARIAQPLLAARGFDVGMNRPYSGRDLNYTMNRHGEARGLPYLGIEVRNDGLRDARGVAHWTSVLADVVHQLLRQLRRS